MNVYGKLQKCRVELQAMELKKSGKNKFAGFTYYELADILPAINKLMLDNGLSSFVNFGAEQATLTIISTEEAGEKVEFTCPTCGVELKGCTPIQGLGAMQTYIRRYLYINAFEVVEADALDPMVGKEEPKPQQQAKGNKKSNKVSELIELANSKKITLAQLKDVIFKEYKKTEIEKLTDTEYKAIWERLSKK